MFMEREIVSSTQGPGSVLYAWECLICLLSFER